MCVRVYAQKVRMCPPSGHIFATPLPAKHPLLLPPFTSALLTSLFGFGNASYFISASQTTTHLRCIMIYAKEQNCLV